MTEVAFTDVLVVAAVAFAAPLVLGLAPGLRLPAVVLELLAGVALGPSALGWLEPSTPVRLLSVIGLAFLLLLAGLEVDPERLRDRQFGVAALAFVASLGLALGVGLLLDVVGLAGSPLLLAIMLSATSLGVVIPVLKDAGRSAAALGQLVLAAASIADIATIALLSLFFSGESGGAGSRAVLLSGFVLVVVGVAVSVSAAERIPRLTTALVRLQDTTAQIRVRGAFALLVLFVVLAGELGLETILGAFMAGVVLRLVDRDRAMTHPRFHEKLEAVGFGVFVPFFFVTSGLTLDVDALLADGSTLALVPLFLGALVLVRGVPALLYTPTLGLRRSAAAGLLQATSLGFLVVGGELGVELGLLSTSTEAALVAAGLCSVLLFPAGALALLRREPRSAGLPVAEGA